MQVHFAAWSGRLPAPPSDLLARASCRSLLSPPAPDGNRPTPHCSLQSLLLAAAWRRALCLIVRAAFTSRPSDFR